MKRVTLVFRRQVEIGATKYFLLNRVEQDRRQCEGLHSA